MSRLTSGRLVLRLGSALLALCVGIGQILPASADAADDVRASIPRNLNLRSLQRTAVAPDSLTSPVTINNSGKQQDVTAGMRLTPAQALAVAQILETGTQSIVLGTRGRARGGFADLTGFSNLDSLRVPRNVSVMRDFAAGATFNFVGDLVNAGNIYAVSSDSKVSTAVFNADNIHNRAGGLITTILPGGGLPTVAKPIDSLNLSLLARDSIFNEGTISSASNLTMSARGRIVNAVPNGVGQAFISATNNINITTQNLVNSGLVQAGNDLTIAAHLLRGRIFFPSDGHLLDELDADSIICCYPKPIPLPGPTTFPPGRAVEDMVVNNSGGVLEAQKGIINFNLTNAGKGLKLTVAGGDVLAKEVNVDAGSGHVQLVVDKLPGTLNVKAGSAFVGAGSDLNMGTMDLSGDPTFFALGDMTVGDLSFNERITLLATGNILLGSGTITSREAPGTQGFDITIVAGANLDINGGGSSTSNPTNGSQDLPDEANVIVLGAGGGGKIDCPSCTIDASSTGQNQNAGKILLAAFSGNDNDGDIVLGGGSSLKTNSGSGQAGNVTIIAPGEIQIDDIEMNGPLGSPILTVAAAQPNGELTAKTDGITSGSLSASKTLAAAGKITLNGDIEANGGTVNLKAGNPNSADVFLSSGSSINVSGDVLPVVGRTGGKVTISSGGGVTLAGDILADGGDGATVPGSFGSPGAAGGTINITANDGTVGLGTALLSVQGGAGGDGSAGAEGTNNSKAGGAGGLGGGGGSGGAVFITSRFVSMETADVRASGGAGGEGGAGGDGFVDDGAAGGLGGTGAGGGAGGQVVVKATNTFPLTPGSFTLSAPEISADGGEGGDGGAGGAGTDRLMGSGGAGGDGGLAGAGGKGGVITLSTGKNSLVEALFLSDVHANGGGGGSGGAGGEAGNANRGGRGGNSGSGGMGGTGGKLTVAAGAMEFRAVSIEAHGGMGGAAGDAGASGVSNAQNAPGGGDAGVAGAGGAGGKIKVTSTVGAIRVESLTPLPYTIDASGGSAGNNGSGGTGGISPDEGGTGGRGGDSGIGGKGGSISLKSKTEVIAPAGSLYDARGGDSSSASGSGGQGGAGTTNTGGQGGTGGTGATGGVGGKVTVKASIGAMQLGNIDVSGGDGGTPAAGGDGAPGTVSGGTGGRGGNGGEGAKGGKISVSIKSGSITTNGDLSANGGSGGNGSAGGPGGEGLGSASFGGNGGDGGNGNLGASAGSISVKAPTVTVTGLAKSISANGGGGGTGGAGGNGGSNNAISLNSAGDGGNGGTGGISGKSGKVTLSASTAGTIGADVEVTVAGTTGGAGGAGGAGGVSAAGPGGDGGDGGNGGLGGSGGKLTLSNTFTISGAVSFEKGEGGGGGAGGALGTGVPEGGNGGEGGPGLDGVDGTYKGPVLILHKAPLVTSDNGLPAHIELLAPDDRDVHINAGEASVRISQGAVAFIISTGRDLSVLSLHDGATGDVIVTVDSQQIELRAGEQLVLTCESGLGFSDVNPVGRVACRDVKEHSLRGNRRAFVCQFSLPSALGNLKTVKHLALSTEARDRALYGKILKNAAILHMVTPRKGPYKTWMKAGLTARAI